MWRDFHGIGLLLGFKKTGILFFYLEIILHLYLEFYLLDKLLNLSIVWIDSSYLLETLESCEALLEVNVIDSGEIEYISIVRIFLEEEI